MSPSSLPSRASSDCSRCDTARQDCRALFLRGVFLASDANRCGSQPLTSAHPPHPAGLIALPVPFDPTRRHARIRPRSNTPMGMLLPLFCHACALPTRKNGQDGWLCQPLHCSPRRRPAIPTYRLHSPCDFSNHRRRALQFRPRWPAGMSSQPSPFLSTVVGIFRAGI